MPEVNAGDVERLRELKQWSQVHLVVHKPNDLLTAVLSDPSLQAGDRDIPFVNGAAGAGYGQALFDALDEGTTLWVGSYAGGRDEGIVRVKSIERNAWPPTTGILHLAENADIQWENGQYLTVKDEHRIWPKFPRVVIDDVPDPAVITWYKDWDIVHDWQTDEEPPVVIMGPPAVAFIDSGLATLRFWGSDSYSPRGTALSGTIQWLFPNGTPGTAASLGTEGSPHTVTWTLPGVHMVRLMITDADGHVSYGYRPVFILNRSGAGSPYQDFEIRSMTGSFSTGGWGLSVRIFEDANVEDFPEGAMIIIFSEDWYGGEQRSIGGYGDRENVVFVGWIKADTVRKEPMTGEIVFQAHTVDGELRNCPGFPISVESVTDTPANWNEIQDMTLDLVGFYLGYWHSTLYEVTDVLQSGDTRAVKYMDITQANLYNQLDRGIFNETIFTRVLSDRQSRVKYDTNPQFLTNTERDGLDTIMSIEDEDWLGRVDIQEIQQAAISWIDLSGVRVDDQQQVQPVFSLAPGDTPKADGAFRQFTRLVLTDQDDGNMIAGFALANQNKTHPDRTMALSQVRVPLQGNYRVFDLHPQEWVLFPSLVTLREGEGPGINPGTPWPTGTRFIPRDIDISYRNEFGSFLVTIGMEPETWGPAGIAGYYPEDTPEPAPPPPPSPPPPPPEPPPGPWAQKVYIGTRTKGMFRTETFSGLGGAHPIWIPDNDGLVSLAIVQIFPDQWDVAHRRFIISGAAGSRIVYRHYNAISGQNGIATQVLTNAEAVALTGSTSGRIHWITGNINKQGTFYVLFNSAFADNGTWCLRTSNYGNSWSAFQIYNGNFNYLAGNIQAGAFRGTSSYAAGEVIYAALNTGAGGQFHLYASFTNGTTWASRDSLGASVLAPRCMVDGSNQSIVYFGAYIAAANPRELYRSIEHGANLVEVDGANHLGILIGAAAAYGTAWAHIWNKDLVRSLVDDHIWKTLDYCVNWTDHGATGMGVDIISVIHDYPDNLYLAKRESGTIPPNPDQPHVIFVSIEEGQVIEGKSGAHADQSVADGFALDGGGDSIPYDCGGVSEQGMIQIWSET